MIINTNLKKEKEEKQQTSKIPDKKEPPKKQTKNDLMNGLMNRKQT